MTMEGDGYYETIIIMIEEDRTIVSFTLEV